MNVEDFIQCVKNRPILYDRRHKYYKNISMKNKVWESIARQMNETSDVLRIKWKGLKDGYTKYRKQRNSSPGSSIYSKLYYNWCWAEDLKFLEICAKRKPARPNPPLSKLDDSRALDCSLSDPPMSSVTPSTPSTCPTPSRPSSPLGSQLCYHYLPEESLLEHTTLAQKPCRFSETSLKRSSTFKRSRNYTSADEDDDKIHCPRDKRVKSTEAIDLLFKSYAESFKDFSIKTQVDIKLKLAKLFADAEVEDANVEFVSPVYSVVKVESEHDYALSPERSTLEHQVTAPQNAAASFGVAETSEFSYLFKNSPASVHSSNDSNDPQIIEEEYLLS